MNRRLFLKNSAAVAGGIVGLPQFIPSTALGLSDSVAPSDKITVGMIGMGWMGGANMRNFLAEKDAQVVAVCDIDENHLRDAKSKVDQSYGNKDCKVYHDYRDLLARRDIDAVMLALPDHWHGLAGVDAANAGKDIYGEKPLTHNLREGRLLCNAAERNGIVWQTGSWQRSQSNFRFACELVRNGRIGKINRVEVGLPSGHVDFGKTKGQETMGPPPKELDYERWLGPAPLAPYCPARVHMNWRWHLDYGGGQIMDWVGHHVDIAHWGLDLDYSGPIQVEGTGDYPVDGLWNTATKYRVTAKYAQGFDMIMAGGHDEYSFGTKWIGTDGWVFVTRGKIDAYPKTLLRETFSPNEIHLYRSPGHVREFLDCVKSRKQTLTPCEVAHRSAVPGHLGQIAMLLGRKIRFNPETEEILNDPTAVSMLSRSMRSPYTL